MPRMLSLSVSLMIAGTAWGAFAQTLDDETVPVLAPSVDRKAAPEALVSTSVGGQAGILYKDNIYRAHDHKTDDVVTYVAPGFAVKAGNDKFTAKVVGQVEGGAYLDNGNNDYIDANLNGHGSYQLSKGTALLADGDIRRDHVEIGSFVDTPDQRAKNPTIYDYYGGGFGIESFQGANDALFLSAHTDLRFYDYDNVGRVGGGRIINNDRDHNEWDNTARIGYAVRPGLMPYGEVGYNTRHYDTRIDDTALYTRDSDGYDALAGMQFGTKTDPLFADAAAGYMWQDYDDALLKSIHTWKIRGNVVWQARPWLILHGGVDRTTEENTLRGSSGYVKTRVGAGGQYYFRPQWSVATDLHYTNYDFRINPALSSDPDREDDVYDGTLALQYDITEIYHISAEYLYAKRDSNDNQFDFNSNTALLKLAATF